MEEKGKKNAAYLHKLEFCERDFIMVPEVRLHNYLAVSLLEEHTLQSLAH